VTEGHILTFVSSSTQDPATAGLPKDVKYADKEGHSWQKQKGIQLPVKTT